MFILFETSYGLALIEKFQKKNYVKEFKIYVQKISRLVAFRNFESLSEATAALCALVDHKLPNDFKSFLVKHLNFNDLLGVCEGELGTAIERKCLISCVYGKTIFKATRLIRSRIREFFVGVLSFYNHDVVIALSHSLSRYRLKNFPVKADDSIVHAISLLTDTQRQLDEYSSKIHEWFIWHFPVMTPLILFKTEFTKSIKILAKKCQPKIVDMQHALFNKISTVVKEGEFLSLGAINEDEDIGIVKHLCRQVFKISGFKNMLKTYVKIRMDIVAPNLATVVGEHIGAKLIAQSGSLCLLAKQPSSTLQITGAEKALFRALKTNKETPKYGIIFEAFLVRRSNPENKGRIARLLAAKCSLSCRLDAWSNHSSITFGIKNRIRVLSRLRYLENFSE